MTDTSRDVRDEWEQAVAEAAREERAARAALDRASTPARRDRTPEAQTEYDTRLDRWRLASRALVDALKRFAASTDTFAHD